MARDDLDDLEVLLIEDDRAIAEEVVRGLSRNGMRVAHVLTGAAGIQRASSADIVLVDLGLPDLEGTEVCRRLRSRSSIPILVLSARTDEADRVEALNLGADDFLVKPFGIRELVARIHAVRRRSGPGGQLAIEVGPLRLDRRSRTVSLDGRHISLTPKEFDLLAALMEESDVTIHRHELLDQVWHREWYGSGRTLDVHVSSLRRKLGDPRWIITLRGVGFRLQEPRGTWY